MTFVASQTERIKSSLEISSNEIIDKIKPIESQLRFIFKIIRHIKKDKDGKIIDSKDFDVPKCICLLNAIFNDWGFR